MIATNATDIIANSTWVAALDYHAVYSLNFSKSQLQRPTCTVCSASAASTTTTQTPAQRHKVPFEFVCKIALPH